MGGLSRGGKGWTDEQAQTNLQPANVLGGGRVGGGRVGGGVGGLSRGVDGWTDEQAQTNLPLQLLRSWALKFINVQVMSLTSSIYDHFIILPSSVTLTFNLRKPMF